MEGSKLKPQIAAWIEEVTASRSDRRFHDLHLDDISPRFTERSTWVGGAVECLQTAVMVRNSRALPFTVAVGFSLLPHEAPHGLEQDVLPDIQNELDNSPPSLYLFERGREPWLDDRDFRELSQAFRPSVNLPVRSFIREWHDENDSEFRRSLWLAS